MKAARYLMLITCILHATTIVGIDTWKGVASSIESFPLFKKSTWKGMAQGFGAPPTGYVYNFSVYNDANTPVYVSTQDLISVMGACMPKANSWELVTIQPHEHHTVLNKEYYFELAIKSTPNEPANHMPYMQQSDTLYLKDLITLEAPHSTKHHYFHAYLGKKLKNGAWVYGPKAEYLGFYDPTNTKNPGVLLSSTLSGITIKNSTNKDFYIGYSNQSNATSLTRSSYQMLAKITKHSFALYNTPSGTSLLPGTIGIFDASSQNFIASCSLGNQVFKDKPYTLEIYSDATNPTPQIGIQGLMPGNYDLPVSNIRDITPITCTFWRQEANGKKGFMDLPGTVWAVSVGLEDPIMVPIETGEAVSWNIIRPTIGTKGWIYFIYTQTTDEAKAKQFVSRFASGLVGAETIATYQKQSKEQIALAKKHGTAETDLTDKSDNRTAAISESLLVQATEGALDMHQGRMNDPITGIDGYLLGADIFLPCGVGAAEMYYLLFPSWKNDSDLPTMAVQNIYASTLSSVAPKGMPAPTNATTATPTIGNPIIRSSTATPVPTSTVTSVPAPAATSVPSPSTAIKPVDAKPASAVINPNTATISIAQTKARLTKRSGPPKTT